MRERRVRAGLTQRMVGLAIGVSQPGVSRLERGDLAIDGERLDSILEVIDRLAAGTEPGTR